MKKLLAVLLALVLTASCLSGVVFAADAEVSYTVSGVTKEGALTDAVSAITKSGGTIKLLKDISYTGTALYAISSDSSFTLDLNGYCLTSATGGVRVTSNASGTTYITDSVGGGYIASKTLCLLVRTGAIHVNNVDMWCDTQQNIAYYETTDTYNSKNIIENCTILNPIWGALAFNNSVSQETASITLRNVTLANAKSSGSNAVVCQTKAIGANVVLGTGVKLLAYSASDASIVQSIVKKSGETLKKHSMTASVTVAGHTYENLSVWYTDPTKNADAIPATPTDAASVAGWAANNGTSGEGTLAQAVAAVSPLGGAIKLYADVNHTATSYAISSHSSFTLDLNGHTITSAGGGVTVTSSADGEAGTTVIKNGTINANSFSLSINKGSIYLQDVTLWSETKQNIIYVETDPLYNLDNIMEGCTIANPIWGAFSFNNASASQADMRLTVRNSTLAAVKTGGTSVLVLQPAAENPGVILEEGVKLLSYYAKTLPIDSRIRYTGMAPVKGNFGCALEICGKSYTGLTVWNTVADTDTAALPASPADSSAAAGWITADGTTGEGTLAQAMSAVNAKGGTVKLYADVNYTGTNNYAIASNSSFTLDLNGHSVTSATGGVCITNSTSGVTGTTLITDTKGGGCISTNAIAISIHKGSMQLRDLEIWTETKQNIIYNETNPIYNADNLIEGCTIANPIWGALAFNQSTTSQENVSVAIRNSTLACTKAAGNAAIVCQGTAVGAKVTLGGGVKFLAYASSAMSSRITASGETLTKSPVKNSLTVCGNTYENLSVWTTDGTIAANAIPTKSFDGTAAAGWLVDGKLGEGTVVQAAAAVSPRGGAIKLYTDVTYTGTSSYAIGSNSSFTLDLNGHGITSATGGVTVYESTSGRTGTLVVTDSVGGGYIDAQSSIVSVQKGGMHLKNLTGWTETKQNIIYNETSGHYNADNIIEGCTIANPIWGALSFNNSSASQKDVAVTLRNSTLACTEVAENNLAIVMQPAAENPTIRLEEGVQLMTYSTGYSMIDYRINAEGTPMLHVGDSAELTILDKKFPGMTLHRSSEIVLPTIDIADTPENRQKAIVETAWAYYYKNPYVQYDSLSYPAGFNLETGELQAAGRTYGSRNGESWSNTPEMASPDREIYHVCSFYVYQCVSLSINYRIMGGWKGYLINPLAEGRAETDELVQVFQYSNYDYDENGLSSTQRPADEIAANMEMAKSLLQPGDLVNYYRTDKLNGGRTHAVLWIGDANGDGLGDLLNVDGKGFKIEYMNDASGVVDKHEATGGVEFNTDNFNCPSGEYFLFSENSSQCLGNPEYIESYSIHRFANIGSLTEASKTRLKYPGLEIYYTAENGIYGAVTKDGSLTYTLEITNNSEQNHTGILVQIPVPENATLTKIDGSATTEKMVSWTLDIAAGVTVTKTYTVKATGDVGKIITASGFVHAIPLGEIYSTIQASAPTASAVTTAMNANKSKTGAAFATAVCKALGVNATIPDADTIMTSLFKERPLNSTVAAYDLVQRDPVKASSAENAALNSMQVYNYFGGYSVVTAQDSMRVNKIYAKDLQAGDILLWQVAAGDETQVAVHNGTNLMHLQNGAFTAMEDQNELDKFLRYRFFIALRPTQLAAETGDDSMTLLNGDGTEVLTSLPAKDFSLRVGMVPSATTTGTLAVATYDASGKMLDLSIASVSLTEGQYTAPRLTVANDGKATRAKVFLLSSLQELKPLSTSVELN